LPPRAFRVPVQLGLHDPRHVLGGDAWPELRRAAGHEYHESAVFGCDQHVTVAEPVDDGTFQYHRGPVDLGDAVAWRGERHLVISAQVKPRFCRPPPWVSYCGDDALNSMGSTPELPDYPRSPAQLIADRRQGNNPTVTGQGPVRQRAETAPWDVRDQTTYRSLQMETLMTNHLRYPTSRMPPAGEFPRAGTRVSGHARRAPNRSAHRWRTSCR
jgi:hypothetical protein